ncbi:amidohydrolase family protein [Pedobacter psychrotolerans]|uniref:amidohydrolase family protein n=1 Tax=Pedobacter psychrotolerans TaxID=1843235 RepID=UPI003F9696E4
MKNYTILSVLFLLCLITGLSFAKAQAVKTTDSLLILTNANVMDVKLGRFISGKDIVISGGRIIALARRGKKWKGTRVIDFKDKFIVPGLIDVHIHVTAPYQNNIENTYSHLEYYLKHGITSIRDPGGDGLAQLEAQTNIREGKRIGATIYFASFMAGDWYFNRNIYLRTKPYQPWEQLIVPGTNLDSAMAVAKNFGATGVKLYHSFDRVFLPKVVAAAKRHGLKVWGHTMMYPATPIDVVGAGVEVLSHVSMLENLTTDTLFFKNQTLASYKDSVIANLDISTFCKMMKKNKAILDATLVVSEERDPWVFSLLKRVHQEGVEIAAGTDKVVGITRPYPVLLDELNFFVTKCGFTTAEALRAATVVGARVIGREKHLGKIEKNMDADLLVLKGNPLKDIMELANIEMVIKSGKMVN